MKRSPLLGALAFGSAFFLISWVFWSDSRHFIEGGDIFFPLDQRLLLSKIAQAWWPDQLGSLLYNASGIPVRGFLAFLQVLGFTPVAIDRAFLAFFYGLSAAAMFLLASRFWSSRRGAWVAAIWYPCGIYYCQAIPNENNVVSLALVPLLAYFAIRAFESPAYILAFSFASLSLGFIGANPPTLLLSAALIAVLCVISLIGVDTPPRRRLVTALLLLAVPFVLNVWWIELARVAIHTNIIVAQGATDWSWVLRRSTFTNILEQTSYWGFGYGSDPWLSIGTWYQTSPIGRIALLLTPLAALAGVLSASTDPDRRRARVLAWCCIAAIVLAKGTHAPGGSFNALLYRYVPLMFLFREPVKFLVVLATAFPLLAALAYANFTQKLTSRAIVALGAAFVAVAVVTGWPLLSGWAFSYSTGQQSRVQIPSYWQDAARFINRSNAAHQRVLILPEDGFYQAFYRWGLNGVDRIAESTVFAPVVRVTADQNAYLENQYGAAMIAMIDRAYRAQNGRWLRTELQRTSVGYIILREDLVVDGRSVSLPESRYALALAGARLIARFGALEVYRTSAMPALSTPVAVLRSCASPQGELEAAMRLPAAVTVVRSDTAHCRGNRSFLQTLPRRGAVVPAHAFVLRQISPFGPSRAFFKRHDERVSPTTMLDVSAQTIPPGALAQRKVVSQFSGPWRLARGTGSVMQRCVHLGTAHYVMLTSAASHRSYTALVTFSASAFCPRVTQDAPLSLWQNGRQTIATLLVPTGSLTALIIVRPQSGIGRSENPLPFTPDISVRDIFSTVAMPGRMPVVYQADVPLASQTFIYGVSWPSELVFRLPNGQELSAFVYRNGGSSPELNVDNVFERIFQVRWAGSERPLRTADVVFERIVPLSTTRLVDRLVLEVIRDDRGWSLEQIAHPAYFRPNKGETIYAGTAIANAVASKNGGLDLWWNGGEFDAHPGDWAVMRQSFNDQWDASGASTQAVADGYANAWRFPNGGEHYVYLRLNILELALGVFAGAVLLITMVTIGAILRRSLSQSRSVQLGVGSLRRTRT